MERCDNDKLVFNARVNKDEMIIAISEYEELKEHIKWQKDCIEEDKRNFEKMKIELEKCNLENYKLKTGIINFVKRIGGENG
jgi:hypothetical protein|nr:MAG TPA: hypothetical protein [Caudoviricetes sp.]